MSSRLDSLRLLGRLSGVFSVSARFALWLVGLLAMTRLALQVLAAPFSGWNDARLSISAAMLRGYGLYPLPDNGPLLGNPYGPMFALFFAPAALMPTPALAVSAGTVLTLAVYFLPALWLMSAEAADRPVALAAFAFFCLYTYRLDVLRDAAGGVHPDSLAVGASAAACAVLSRPTRTAMHLWASAAATIVAISAKHVSMFVPFGIAAYLCAVDGAMTGVRYLLAVGGLGSAALAVLACTLDFQAMIHNTIAVPFSQPWRGAGGIWVLVQATRELVFRASSSLAVLLIATTISVTRSAGSLRTWVASNSWVMIVALALFGVPASLLGRVKYGGSVNTLCYTMYFVVLGAILALLRLDRERHSKRRFVPGFFLIAAFWAALVQFRAFLDLPRLLRDLPHNPETTGYAFARAHPQQTYFPHQALISVMAEGKAYQGAVGVEDSAVAGFPLTESEFRAFMPKDLRFVLLRRRVDLERYALRFLPTFRKQIELPELPGWTVLVQEDATPQ
jgi:hypothetical protein